MTNSGSDSELPVPILRRSAALQRKEEFRIRWELQNVENWN
jgi:hypothetical protein